MIKKRSFLTTILISFYTLSLIIYWTRVGGSVNELFRNIVYLAAPIGAVVAGLFAIRSYGIQGLRARTILFLTIGILGWCLGEILYVYYDFILRAKPFPSIADFFYLAGYPFLFLGFLTELHGAQINWKKVHKKIFASALGLGIVGTIAVSLFTIYFAYDSGASTFENLITVSYGIGDLIVLFFLLVLLLLAWEFRQGRLYKIWMSFFLGFLLILIADTLFSIFNQEYTNGYYIYKNVMDSLWIAGYLCFGFGFSQFVTFTKFIQSKLQKQ